MDGEWSTWSRKVSPYSGTQLCVLIEPAVVKEQGLQTGSLVEGRVKGPIDRSAPFTKRVQAIGNSLCIYLDNALLDATGAMRGDEVDVRLRRID